LVGFRDFENLAQIPFFVKELPLDFVNRTDRVVLANLLWTGGHS